MRKDGDIEDDVEHWITAEWLKWRLTSGVLCDRHIPTRLKEEFCKIVIRLASDYRYLLALL